MLDKLGPYSKAEPGAAILALREALPAAASNVPPPRTRASGTHGSSSTLQHVTSLFELDLQRRLADRWRQVAPPSAFAAAHSKVLEALHAFDESARLIRQAVASGEAAKLGDAAVAAARGGVLPQAAAALLPK